MRLAQIFECGDDHRQTKAANEDVEDASNVAQRQRALGRTALAQTYADTNVGFFTHFLAVMGAVTRSTQPYIPSGQVSRLSACLAGFKVECTVFTCVGRQVTLCDPIWQVTLRSCEMEFY